MTFAKLTAFLLLANCQKEEVATVSSTFDPAYEIVYEDATQDKNFFLLSLLQRQPAVRAAVQTDETSRQLAQRYKLAYEAARDNCQGDVNCVHQLLVLDSANIERAAQSLARLAQTTAFQDLIHQHLRPSGLFQRYDTLDDQSLLVNAWRDAARGLNHLLNVYGLGQDPRYAEIDRVSFDVHSPTYQSRVQGQLDSLELEAEPLFFEPTLAYAMGLLAINGRDEAGRYEPLAKGENQATINHLDEIDWTSYDYSLILVLGDSPNSPGDLPNISLGGMARADHGVKRYQEGKAPLLVFSGGHVRPFQTPYSEAIEMKKYVMAEYGIPAEHILVDPHARHTTTNLRNVSRMVFRYGIPADKKAIVTTSDNHSAYLTGHTFAQRCLDELGYRPVVLHDRINDIEVEFSPKKISLQADAMDPLDP